MKRSILAFFVLLIVIQGFVQSNVPISRIKERMEKTGRLKFKLPVEINYVSMNVFRNYINRYFDKGYPAGLAEKETEYLFRMGFLRSKRTVKEIRKKVIMNNAGGFYDEQNGKLFAISEHISSDPVYLLILVHELRHAIQDQHFDISAMFGGLSDFDDKKLALTAAIEGDAMLLMSKYAEKYTPFPVSPELASSGYNSDALLSFSPVKFSYNLGDLPPVIKNHLTMPYMLGLKFVYKIYKRGKWKSVNKILQNPPLSTEQILHPEKYLKGEKPVYPVISYVPEGYQLFHSGTIGEYMLNILLMEKNTYKDYASGWGGDVFRLYRKGGSYLLAWKSVWDKEEYCSRFHTDFRNFTESESGISYKEGNVKGNPFIAGKNKGQYFFIRKFGRTMFFVKSNDRATINNFINGGYYD